MIPANAFATKVHGIEFLVTAEYLPIAGTEVAAHAQHFGSSLAAVNVADNHYGVAMSSLAAALALQQQGIEPVWQLVTRDRNRIALQSDLLGAASLGIRNVLCLSGFHQTAIGCGESANVYDIDSIQLIDLIEKMNHGQLLDGQPIQGQFNMVIGAVANPSLQPLALNILRLRKKIAAGAAFIQTQAVFDVAAFTTWLAAARAAGLTEKTAILAGVLPLQSAAQAQALVEAHTDFVIPEAVMHRLAQCGSAEAQRQEGVQIAAEIIGQLKGLPGLRGIHLLSGGHEASVSALAALAS